MFEKLKRKWAFQKVNTRNIGQTMAEYAVILSIAVVVATLIVSPLNGTLNSALKNANKKLDKGAVEETPDGPVEPKEGVIYVDCSDLISKLTKDNYNTIKSKSMSFSRSLTAPADGVKTVDFSVAQDRSALAWVTDD